MQVRLGRVEPDYLVVRPQQDQLIGKVADDRQAMLDGFQRLLFVDLDPGIVDEHREVIRTRLKMGSQLLRLQHAAVDDQRRQIDPPLLH